LRSHDFAQRTSERVFGDKTGHLAPGSGAEIASAGPDEEASPFGHAGDIVCDPGGGLIDPPDRLHRVFAQMHGTFSPGEEAHGLLFLLYEVANWVLRAV
jgi:hypothetical protein